MLPVILFLAFLVMPVLEIYVIIQVGSVIGGWETAFLLLAESLFGAWIMKREGRKAWRKLNGTLAEGRMPDKELADAALVLVGGVLLLTPGFITDVVGFLCVLPFTRPLVRGVLLAWASKRVKVAAPPMMFPPGFGGPQTSGSTAPAGEKVVQGEVLRDDEQR